MGSHLNSCQTPVLSVVMALVRAFTNSRPLQRLIFGKAGQDSEDDRDTCT